MRNLTQNPILSAVSVSAVLFALVACKPSDSGSSSDVLKAFPAQADLAMYFDQASLSDSAFSEAMQEMEDEMSDMPSAGMANALGDKITELTGLDDDDITEIAFSISNIDAFATDPSLVQMSGAVAVKKEVSAAQIAEAIEFAAAENGEELDLDVVPGEKADFIEFPQEEDMPELIAAVMTGGSSTVAFFGDRPSVEAALSRDSGSVPSALSDPSAGLIDGQQGWVSLILTDALKAQLDGVAALGAQRAPGLDRIESLESAGMAVKAGESMQIAVGLNLGSEADAQAITGVLNNQLISMARIMVAGNTPEPLPLLDTLSASSEGNRSILSLEISIEDLEIFQDQMANFRLPGMSQ